MTSNNVPEKKIPDPDQLISRVKIEMQIIGWNLEGMGEKQKYPLKNRSPQNDDDDRPTLRFLIGQRPFCKRTPENKVPVFAFPCWRRRRRLYQIYQAFVVFSLAKTAGAGKPLSVNPRPAGGRWTIILSII